MREFRAGSGMRAARRAVGVAWLVAAGCGPQEELKPDPGVSPLFPGSSAESKSATAPLPAGVEANRPASGLDDAPLRPVDVEKQLRIALRAADKGDLARASSLLDRILALEPINREALYGRASVALSQAPKAASPDDRLAAIEKADAVCKTIRRAYDRPSKRELELYSRVFNDLLTANLDQGHLDRAVAVLKEAHDTGFEPFDVIERDPKMAKIRDFPAYRSLAEAVRAEGLARARAQVEGLFASTPKYDFAFRTRDLDGKPLTLDQFRGQVLLVDLWGTWCQPCLETIPGLIKLRNKYASRGFDVIGLDFERDENDPKAAEGLVRKFVKDSAIPYRIAMLDDELRDKVPNLEGFPTTLLIDRTGKVRLQLTGGGPSALSTLDAAIQILLAEPSGSGGKGPVGPAATGSKPPPPTEDKGAAPR